MADWLDALRAEVAKTSQVATARRLGLSPTTISLVLQGKYNASTARIEEIVRAELMGDEVDCPVLSWIARKLCHEFQEKARAGRTPASAIHREVYATCTGGCPHSSVSEKAR